jgi:hypothetical protein
MAIDSNMKNLIKYTKSITISSSSGLAQFTCVEEVYKFIKNPANFSFFPEHKSLIFKWKILAEEYEKVVKYKI